GEPRGGGCTLQRLPRQAGQELLGRHGWQEGRGVDCLAGDTGANTAVAHVVAAGEHRNQPLARRRADRRVVYRDDAALRDLVPNGLALPRARAGAALDRDVAAGEGEDEKRDQLLVG